MKALIGRVTSMVTPPPPPNRRSGSVLMRGARWRLALVSLVLLAIVAVALTPTERAEAQSVPNVFWNSVAITLFEPGTLVESRREVVRLQVSQNLSAPLTVSYTMGGTATPGVDYTIDAGSPAYAARTGTFTIPSGTPRFTNVAIPITVLEDAVTDHGETIILAFTAGADYGVNQTSTTTITIAEETGRPAFRIGGQPQVNGTLTLQKVCADPDGEGTSAHRWERSSTSGVTGWTPISDSQSYTLQQADVGHYIRSRILHDDGSGGSERFFTPIVGPIGPVAVDNTVKFSRNSYNAREGDPLRPTLTFSSPTKRARTFEIGFHNCDADLNKDIVVDVPSAVQFGGGLDALAATHSVTVPAGVTSHTFSLPVLLDDRIEGYETFVMGFWDVPRGISIGSQQDATNQGTFAQVQIADVNFVPENWPLKPSGVSAGDQFRLLFKTENERNAESGNIGDYDTFVRNRIGGTSTGHADIRQYQDTFRVVGSTGTVDAAWHTATGIMVSGEPSHTPFSHPIYWMGGPKVADDYNDFWDGTWDANRQTGPHQRNALGVVTTNKRGPNTGTKSGTTHATAGAKATYHLGHSTHTRWGGNMQNHNPINQGQIPVGDTNVYLGLSGIFLPLDVSAANPLVTIETRRARVEEGTVITYTLRAVPAPSSPVTVNLKVTETTDGGPNFVDSGDQGPKTETIPTSGVATFTVETVDDNLGEPDGGVTVSIGSGTGYRTLAASDTVMTVITSSDISLDISAGAALGDGSNGPAQTGANVDFTFSLPKALEGRELSGIRTQLAWGGDVLSPRSDHRPATWDRYVLNPDWKPDGSARVNIMGAYVRPWLESSIMPGDRSFSRRVHVKNRAEAGGEVGNGWIAMRVAPDPNPDDKSNNYIAHPDAGWACMPVGGGTCPSAWPGVPAASIAALDNGTVMSGNDARYRITVNPAPPSGQTRRVYLKTWEVFITANDPPCDRYGDFLVPDSRGGRYGEWDPYKHCDPPLRTGEENVQRTAHTHVDVGSGGTADITLPTEIYRSTENMSGRNYWAEVQEDVAYSVGGSSAEVVTKIFNPNAAACWYGHSHHRARLITVDGSQVYSPGGMGITECLTEEEIDEWSYGNGSTADRPTVWTGCKPDYGHREHPYTDGNGNIHHHHNHNPYLKLGDGSCPVGQMQTDGGDSQDGEQDQQDDPFPDPGALGFSAVTASSVTLSWPQREVDHYLVYWAENVAGAETQSAQVDAGTLTYTITGLKADTEYAVIVYSQDYDEVTPTGYQRTAAASCTPNLPSDAITVSEVKTWRGEYSQDSHVSRWNRVLAALGEDTGETAMTADQARDIKSRIDNTRWDRTVRTLEAMEQCADSTDTTQTVTPEISITGGSGITEGGNASFTVTANPAPAANLDVTVAVAQSGDYGVSTGSQTVSIPTTGSATLTVATGDDNVDEADGSVTATVSSGTGYTVSATAGSATVAVADDDDTAPQSCTPNLPSDAITVSEVKTWRGEYSQDSHVSRWNRVLAALGEDTGETAMTADQAREIKSRIDNTRWDRTVRTLEALEQCAGSADTTTPATPEVSIAGGNGITEGGNATFTVSANPAPAANLDVAVAVAQTGDYGASTGSQTVSIPTSGSATLTVATSDDGVDESDGSVTATVNSGQGYTVSATAGAATVAVADDDVPEISIVSDGDITEGGDASFTVTASPAPHAPLSVSVVISQSGDFGVTPGAQTVSIPTSGSATLTIATTNDSVDEADGSVTATVSAGQGYTVSSTADSATVAVADDDATLPGTPEISITAGSGVTEGGNATFTLTANPAPTTALDVSVGVAQTGDYGASTGSQTVSIPTSGSYTLTVATVNDVVDEADGSVTVTVGAGQGYTVSTTAGSATVAVADDDVPEISITGGSGVTEGGNATFTLTANPAPHAPLSVSVSVSQSGDYGVTPGSQTVSIPTTGSYTLTVATVNDGADEADGSVTAIVSAGTGYTVSATAGTATVAVADDDDPPPPDATPSLSVSDASAREDAGVMEFTVSLSAASEKKVQVYAATTSFLHKTATNGDDFEWTQVLLTFAPGETSKTVQVVILDDDLSEGDESFGMFLAYSPSDTPLTREHGEGVIIDDD